MYVLGFNIYYVFLINWALCSSMYKVHNGTCAGTLTAEIIEQLDLEM